MAACFFLKLGRHCVQCVGPQGLLWNWESQVGEQQRGFGASQGCPQLLYLSILLVFSLFIYSFFFAVFFSQLHYYLIWGHQHLQ